MPWIKVEHTLPEKPEVDSLAAILSLDPDAVVGKLIRTWVWADQHSIIGHAVNVTAASIDRRAHCPGFADGLRKVGWLEGRDGALLFPRFDRHNGQTAKSRALATNRQSDKRGKECHAPSVTKALPEKSRGDENRESEAKPPALAQIPTAEEVITACLSFHPPAPESYALHQHAKHSEEHRWLVSGRLIDWKAKLRRYWSTDKDTWRNGDAKKTEHKRIATPEEIYGIRPQ